MLVGVEPEPLLEALVEIEGLITDSGSPLPLRAGFTTGPVILIDGDDYRPCGQPCGPVVRCGRTSAGTRHRRRHRAPLHRHRVGACRSARFPVSRTPSTSSRSDADGVDPDRSTWTDFERAAGAVLDALQPGDLVTYGEVAAEAGYPGAARAVGSLLRRAPSGTFAWWRVIAASGRLLASHEVEQRRGYGGRGRGA